ncbi:MAG: CHAT domain-containing protein [Armatimonadetes bacterium]|nr:CHAT domain-containing protein [Armatimonadota bacterium]
MNLFLAADRVVVGETTLPLDPPLDAAEFQAEWDLLAAVANPERTVDPAGYQRAVETVDAAWLRSFGRRLFDRVFVGPLADAWHEGSDPLILTVHEPPGDSSDTLRLTDLPWELLHDGTSWAARTRGVVRNAAGAGRLPSAQPGGGRLNILAVLASPLIIERMPDVDGNLVEAEPDDPRQPHVLDIEREADLFRGLHGRPIPADINLRLHVSPEDLDFALGDADVLHFVGHGTVGMLLLESRHGTGRTVDTDWLRERFARRRLQFAVFQSCLTGRRAGVVSGVALTLVEAGVPVVLAMMQSVSVDAARVFFSRLYEELGRGAPVDQAVTGGRRAVADEPAVAPWEWATPVLFACVDALSQAVRWPYDVAAKGAGRAMVITLPGPPIDPLMTRPEHFVGRRRELVKVARGIDPQDGARVTLLHGEGGMGKTAIAFEAAHRWAGWFDQVVYLSARDVVPPPEVATHLAGVSRTELDHRELPGDARAADTPARETRLSEAGEVEFIHALARKIGIQTRGDEAPAQILAATLNVLGDARRRLLVLDNLETLTDSPMLLDLLDHLPRYARCLATSRHGLAVDTHTVEVRGMTPRDALLLIAGYAGEKPVGLTRRRAGELYQKTGGHPMTMRLVVAQVSSSARTWDAALDDLRNARGDVFQYVFARSLQAAGEDGRWLLGLCALFAPFARREVLLAASGWGDARFGATLARLRDLALIELHSGAAFGHIVRQPDQGYTLKPGSGSDLIGLQELARAQAGALLRGAPADDVDACRGRGIEALLPVAEFYNQLQMHQWPAFDADWLNLLAALESLSQRPEAKPLLIARYVSALSQPLRLRYVAGQEKWLQAGLVGARLAGERRLEANVLKAIGDVQNFRDERDAALKSYNEALGLYRQVGDKLGEANVLQAIGDVQNFRKEMDAALKSYNEALGLYRQVGDKLGEANIFLAVGRIALAAGDEQNGIQRLEHATGLFEVIGDQSGSANVRIVLGRYAASKGNYQAAIDYMQPAADFGKRIGHPLGDELQKEIDV